MFSVASVAYDTTDVALAAALWRLERAGAPVAEGAGHNSPMELATFRRTAIDILCQVV